MTDFIVELVDDNNYTVISTQKTEIVETCEQGPPGTAGQDVKFSARSSFDSSMVVLDLFTPTLDITITNVSVRVTALFSDDPAARLSVGTDSDNDEFLNGDFINPQGLYEYESKRDIDVAAGTTIKLFITTTGTMGAGIASVEYYVTGA